MYEQTMKLKINTNFNEIEKMISNLITKIGKLKNSIDTSNESAKLLNESLTLNDAQAGIKDSTSLVEKLNTKIKEVSKELNSISSIKKDSLLPDLSGIIANVAGVLAIITTLAAPIKKIFSSIDLSSLFQNIGTSFSSFAGTVSTSSTGVIGIIGAVVAVIAGIGLALKYVYDTNNQVREGVENAISSIQEKLGPLNEVIGKIFDLFGEIISTVFEPFVTFIDETFASVWNDILIPILEYFANTIIPNVTSTLENLKTNILEPLHEFLEVKLVPIFEKICEIFKIVYEEYIKPIAEFIGTIFKTAWETLHLVINNLVIPIFSGLIKVLTWLWKNILTPITDFLFSIFKPSFESVCKSIGEVFNGLKTTFNGVLDFIKGIFSLDWELAWNGIVKIFTGIFDTIGVVAKAPLNLVLSFVETIINKIIDGFNWVKQQINKISVDLPDWLGGHHIGFNLDMTSHINIPRLENGGFPKHGSMFIAGENGPEIVGHIGARTEVLNASQISGAIYSAVATALRENSSNGQDIRVYAEDGLLVEKVSRGIDKHIKQTGRLPFTIPL